MWIERRELHGEKYIMIWLFMFDVFFCSFIIFVEVDLKSIV